MHVQTYTIFVYLQTITSVRTLQIIPSGASSDDNCDGWLVDSVCPQSGNLDEPSTLKTDYPDQLGHQQTGC